MAAQITMFENETTDNDTLGGRIWRAREAANFSEAAFARSLGVKRETLAAWENDRSEPRANRLVTMAGLLGVSAGWLLHGIGEAPLDETISSELDILRAQLARIKEFRDQTSVAIANMEKAIDRLAKNARDV